MNRFVPGQRWISESEPELGLGKIVEAASGRVQVIFAGTGETRTYSMEAAPLKRVRFRPGDRVKSADGHELVVREVTEEKGLLVYLSDKERLREESLSDGMTFHGPEERLITARFDDFSRFELRRRTLELRHRMRKSPVRGFLGGRIDLIPHQLYIAQEVASRQAPRVMLSDETGLGKTIEACLILHRMLVTGRAERILVLVPESLVHQWFVEMLRRFNVRLNIFDEERCAAIERGEEGANPFLDEQLALVSVDFLAQRPNRWAQAVAAKWDILVVDEAHHLQWSEGNASPEYRLVEELSRSAAGLLLLTATPEQLGVESHFGRLRLLDPDRYKDLSSFRAEAKEFKEVADLAERLTGDGELGVREVQVLKKLLAHDEGLEKKLGAVAAESMTISASPTSQSVESARGLAQSKTLARPTSPSGAPRGLGLRQSSGAFDSPGASESSSSTQATRIELLNELLDLHGPGRVLFRNTRKAMSGFPKRHSHLNKLQAGPHQEDLLDRLATEFATDAGDRNLECSFDFKQEPRVLWLLRLLEELGKEKMLLICRSIEKVEAIDEALRAYASIKTGIFHEGLTLVQRDRNAAWFAEPEGARLLLCSEIGSEGRNFQFAHYLVLFDLPLNPELLEQRIGRLDRIGQKHDIHIHVPYVARSPQEVLARWYAEGLDAFETTLEGGNELLQQFGRQVHDLGLEFPVAEANVAERELEALVKNTRSARQELRRILEQGRDRLLEMNSFRPAVAEEIIQAIRAEDRILALEEYLLDVFENFGVHAEELAPHTWQLNPQGVTTDAFPAMPAEGLLATCDRSRALGREDVAFLTWDHPMVVGAMELLLGSEAGNCAFAVFPVETERTLLLEFVFVLEVVADARLHVDRFLPATPIRLVVNHKLEEVGAAQPAEALELNLQKGAPYKLTDNREISSKTLPAMLAKGAELAEVNAKALREQALTEMQRLMGYEVERLKILQQVNEHVRPEEIQLAEAERQNLADAICKARVRLDSLRLIWKGPPRVLAG